MPKPADHPDFFRFPAPPGRSRESAIVLDADGRFWDHGQPVENPAMQRAFHRWIEKHPDDGRFILTNGYDWTYFTVEDAPFLITRCAPGLAGLLLRLDDDSEEPLNGPLWVGARGALYTRVKGGRFDARFDRAVQAGLGEILVSTPDGGFGLATGQTILPVRQAPPAGSPGLR
jgi:hypothetical protein